MRHVLYRQSNINSIIDETVFVLKKGGLVVFPSDTVYGLLVDTQQVDAVKKLIAFKNRPPGKPISVFVTDLSMMNEYAKIDTRQRKILSSFLPGPFTVILDSKHKTSSLLESERGTLGLRYPDYEPVNELMRKFSKPVTATSANISGKHPHYQAASLLEQLSQKKKDLIDLVVDAGKLPHNEPSTIIDLTRENIKILRKGDIVFSSSESFLSNTPAQTRKIAKFILSKYRGEKSKPIVFILKGDLGAGKTVFVKGVGEQFGIDNIISPTYTVSYEYDLTSGEKFIHYDLYNIQEETELNYLGFEQTMKKGNIICIEWGEKAGAIIDMFRKKAQVVLIEISYTAKDQREIRAHIMN